MERFSVPEPRNIYLESDDVEGLLCLTWDKVQLEITDNAIVVYPRGLTEQFRFNDLNKAFKKVVEYA